MSARSQFSVYIATSLDGYIARPDGAIDWLSIVEQPGEDYGYQAFMSTIDTLVMGRKTYDTVLRLGAWPYAGKRCVVLTTHLSAACNGEEFVCGDPVSIAARLGEDGARRVYVDGGDVIRQFLAAGLLDDLTISVVPILLGDGIPLFREGAKEQRLKLVEERTFPSGLIQLRYLVEATRHGAQSVARTPRPAPCSQGEGAD